MLKPFRDILVNTDCVSVGPSGVSGFKSSFEFAQF